MNKRFLLFFVFSILIVSGVFSDEKSDKTLSLLQKLSGDTQIWSGTSGENMISRMNKALYNAANTKGPSEASVLYMALKEYTSGLSEAEWKKLWNKYSPNLGYINIMILMENGLYPETIIAIINYIVKTMPADYYALHFMEQLDLPQNAAESLVKIIKTQGDFLKNPSF